MRLRRYPALAALIILAIPLGGCDIGSFRRDIGSAEVETIIRTLNLALTESQLQLTQRKQRLCVTDATAKLALDGERFAEWLRQSLE